MDIIKISDSEIEITKTTTPSPVTTTTRYERKFIEEQVKQITAQRDALIAIKEAELKECKDILSEMDKLEIIVKPIEDEPIKIGG